MDSADLRYPPDSRARAPRRTRSLPWLTSALALFALVLGLFPGAPEALQLDRAAVAQGQIHRLITGHITHWTANHLLWDVIAFLVLGVILERVSRRLLLQSVCLGAILVSGAVWFFEPGISTYRGLSGIDSALFATLVLIVARDHLRPGWERLSAGLAFAALIGKTCWEFTHPQSLFVAADPAFIPVPTAHLAGAVAAIINLVGLAKTSLFRPRDDSFRSTIAIPDHRAETLPVHIPDRAFSATE